MSQGANGVRASQPAEAAQREIAVIGAGYVGLTSAVCLAELGNRVIAFDIDERKVAGLQQAVSPIFEVGLDEMLAKHRQTNRLSFTTSLAQATEAAEFILICVATPSGPDGALDLSQVNTAALSLAQHLPTDRHVTVVIKSTLPVGSAEEVESLLALHAPGASFTVLTNPEFLREGRAVYDAFHPVRIVIGSTDPRVAAEFADLYRDLGSPVLFTDRRSAELIKQASNAFLATKISFANQLAELCERVGADVSIVTKGMGLDPRIGAGHLVAGLGYGGSCLPKDVEGLLATAAQVGLDMPLLAAAQEINRRQRLRSVDRMEELLGGLAGRSVGIWGLAFKEGTDDLRDAPAIAMIEDLRARGVAHIRAYDPQAMGWAMPLLADVTLCPDPYETVRDVDALLLTTAWPEFAEADLGRVAGLMRGRVLIDGRGQLTAAAAREAGFEYWAIGIPQPETPHLTPDALASDLSAS